MRKLVVIFVLVLISTGCTQSIPKKELGTTGAVASKCESNSTINQPLSEEKYIPVGGIEQWITIKGESCSNPVILFLHGGPGNPESIYADSVYGEWESTFTIVHWDQRAAGKTYGRNPEPVELNVDLMVQDGIEVAEYLLSYLNKEKIILVGNSWGSILGIYMIHENPELFFAYVGTSQAGLDADGINTYNKTLAVSKEAADQEAIAALEDLGTPPWTNPRNFGIFRRIQRPLEAAVAGPRPSSWVASPSYTSPEDRQNYVAGEDFSYIQYIGINGGGFSQDIDLNALGHNFQIPVYLIQGEEDLLTTPELSKQYFDRIVAPDKDYILLPSVGHAPNELSHAANYRILVEKVLPLTK
jgi:pimeloyl-ACP methyl ester carboxylesterase